MLRSKHTIINFVTVFAFFITLTARSAEFLPQGWTAHSSNGQTYYYNQKSGTSQWEKPILSQNVNQQGSSQAHRNQGIPSSSMDSRRQETVYQQSTTGNAQYLSQEVQQQYALHTNQQQYSGAAKFAGNPGPKMQRPQTTSGYGATMQQNSSATVTTDSDSLRKGDSAPLASLNLGATTENPTATAVQTDTKHPADYDFSTISKESFVPNASATITSDGYKASEPKLVDIVTVHPDTQRVESELREAERKIDDLKMMIDGLEIEKLELTERVKLGEIAVLNLTSECSAAATLMEQSSLQLQEELNSQMMIIQSELDKKNEELENLKTEKESLDSDLVQVKEQAASAQLDLFGLKSNSTKMVEDLKISRIRISEQEKELADAYKEIGHLMEDMKNVAEPTMRRLRQPSFFSRLLQSAFPVWSGKVSPKVKKGKSKPTVAVVSATSDTLMSLNKTAISLRENITAIAAALEGKEEIIAELSAQLAERADEAEKR
jgi:predicted  nucleic acid-binding Zn-ribbon protein